MKVSAYKKEFAYSYAIGVFATIELLEHQTTAVTQVLLHSKGDKNSGVEKIRKYCKENNIPLEIADRQVEQLSKSENTYAIGFFEKYESRVMDQENHLMLVNPSDTGNLGTIIRTALGFGIKNLIIIRPGVDIFDPKVIRASQGGVFQMNVLYLDSFDAYKKMFSNTCYPFMLDGKVSLEEVRFEKPYTLIFGNEGSGLDASYQEIGTSIRIPQTENIDSLNLAISAGIGLYKAYISRHSGE